MANFNEGNRRGNFNKNGGNKRSSGFNKEAAAAKKAEILTKQTASLNMINDVATFLNTFVSAEDVVKRTTMGEIINYLTEVKGYSQDSTRAVSQYNYILMDIANARKTSYIGMDRIFIRTIYFYERLVSSFKKDLQETIDSIINNNTTLFGYGVSDILGAVAVESVDDEKSGVEG